MLTETKFTSFRNRKIGMPVLKLNPNFEDEHNYALIKLLKKNSSKSSFSSNCMLTVVDPNDMIVKSCKGLKGGCNNCCFHTNNINFLGIKIISIILKSNYKQLT